MLVIRIICAIIRFGVRSPVEDLECEVSGVGGMEVNATQKLDASTSGVGSVKYKGNPEHTQKSASGVGKIKQAD